MLVALYTVAGNIKGIWTPAMAQEKVTTIDGLVDIAILEYRRLMNDFALSVISLPDVHKSISYRPFGFAYHGELDLSNGVLQGLTTLYRYGNVVIEYGKNRKLTILTRLSFEDFLINFDFSVKLMKLGPAGVIEGRAREIKLLTKVEFDFDTLYIKLIKFQVEQTGCISVSVQGNSIASWLFNLLSSIALTVFKGIIRRVAESAIRDNFIQLFNSLNDAMSKVQKPQFTVSTE